MVSCSLRSQAAELLRNSAQEWLRPSWTSPPTFGEGRRSGEEASGFRPDVTSLALPRTGPELATGSPDFVFGPLYASSFSGDSACFWWDLLGRIGAGYYIQQSPSPPARRYPTSSGRCFLTLGPLQPKPVQQTRFPLGPLLNRLSSLLPVDPVLQNLHAVPQCAPQMQWCPWRSDCC